MKLELEIQSDLSATPERVYDLACSDENLPRFFQRSGAIPGVTGSRALAAEPNELARREVMLSDGTSMVEIITARERPHTQQYSWAHAPAPPLHLLVRGAEAKWKFQPAAGGGRTRVSLQYTFLLTSQLALPFALVVRALFKRWLTAALARIKREAEAPAA